VITGLAALVREQAGTPQIGRTHGQHALPVTVGFWLAGILHRLLWCEAELDHAAEALVGKISGAVGASNAIVGLGFDKLSGDLNYEARVLGKLGLTPARYSTQIIPPEPLAHFLYLVTVTTSVFGQLGRDGRQLMRTEIGELAEPFVAGQVGSSTMAHKRNPITFEGLEAAWLKTKNEFGKVLDSSISEHQRDLVGSAVMRDYPVILVNLMTQINTLRRRGADGKIWLERLQFVPEALERNFALSSNVILAEPLYIAVQMAGYEGDGHKLVSDVLTPRALASGRTLMAELEEVAAEDAALREVLERIPAELRKLLTHPESYTGNAGARALAIADLAE
jgi:adenylosuccinate lyase